MQLFIVLCLVGLQYGAVSSGRTLQSNLKKDYEISDFPGPGEGLKKRQECVDKRNCTWVRIIYQLNTQRKLEEFCEEYKMLSLIKECARTCGHCKLPNPPAPEPLKCADESDCSALPKLFNDRASLDDYCDQHKDKQFIKQCRYTCGFCKAPAAPENCKDERSDCSKIVEMHKGNDKALKDYCKHWIQAKDSAVLKCRKTCGACEKAPHPPQPIECKDERNDCNKIVDMFKGNNEAMQEYCDIYIQKKDPAVLKCKKTCGACKAPAQPEPSKVCEDTREGGCSWITKHIADPKAYCEAWKEDEAVKKCRKTCGFCK